MRLEIVRNDITKMNVDAIVNAANKTLLGAEAVTEPYTARRARGCLPNVKLSEAVRRERGAEAVSVPG